MNIIKKCFFGFIFALVLFSILFGIIELLFALKVVQPSFHMHGMDVVLDRKLLYRIKPNSAKDINRFGYRTHDYEIKKSQQRVVFLGDSFVMGTDIKSDQTISVELQRLLDAVEVINMGVLGYGPDQSLLQIKEDVLKLGPDLVILGIYPRNDFKDITRNRLFNLNFYDQLIRSRSNVVEDVLPDTNTGFLLQYLAYKFGWFDTPYESLFTTLFGDNNDYFMFFPHIRFNKHRFKAMHRVLEKIKDELDANGIRLMVVVFPSYESVEDNMSLIKKHVHPQRIFMGEDLIEKICKSLGIYVINLYPNFLDNKKEYSRYTTDKTYHFTPETTKEVARLIKNDVDVILHLK